MSSHVSISIEWWGLSSTSWIWSPQGNCTCACCYRPLPVGFQAGVGVLVTDSIQSRYVCHECRWFGWGSPSFGCRTTIPVLVAWLVLWGYCKKQGYEGWYVVGVGVLRPIKCKNTKALWVQTMWVYSSISSVFRQTYLSSTQWSRFVLAVTTSNRL